MVNVSQKVKSKRLPNRRNWKKKKDVLGIKIAILEKKRGSKGDGNDFQHYENNDVGMNVRCLNKGEDEDC